MQANLGMVAGEASGDMLAASVLEALQARRGAGTGEDRLQMAGIGGPAMASRGFDCWWPSELLAVHGYAAALKVYPKLLAIRRRLEDVAGNERLVVRFEELHRQLACGCAERVAEAIDEQLEAGR